MTLFVACGNIQQPYPLQDIPADLFTDELLLPSNGNPRVRQRHRCRWVAHFLLWKLLKKAQINTALLGRIYRTASGRPQFPIPHIDFNISHCGDWVAVILQIGNQHQHSVVGIDIEYAQKARNYTALLGHFASECEQQWFLRQQDAAGSFYRIWCLREAVLKSQGVGIVKLSEVRHDPLNLSLHSAYCPRGQLLFSAQFPFYLAFFTNLGFAALQCFRWDGEGLAAEKLQHPLIYSVNY
ncbi:4'-phosphopantetheinyl transferase superfamily protein [Necropsobacter rosorum]|uniref:4'-phosphopantetheinyl transferase family protein n=1 Tax=Necropsobacter rosorum TaxID=908285 RepID=UPI000509E96E